MSAELFSLTFMGVAQRGRLYANDSVTSGARELFRSSLRHLLGDIVKVYATQMGDAVHVENILKIVDTISGKHPGIIKDDKFRIGSAQKALNRYLKYLCCMGYIPSPPHCLFDATIIDQLLGCQKIKWTQFDDIEDYPRRVDAKKRRRVTAR